MIGSRPLKGHRIRRGTNITRIAFFALAALSTMTVTRAEFRTFTDQHGRTIQAEKVRVENDAVVLRLATGRLLTVPLAQLSDADRAALLPAPAADPAANSPAPATAPAAWDYDAKPHGVPDLAVARFRVWIPDAAKPVRGMIVLVPGVNGDGRGDATAADWQALATELGFGLIGCNFSTGGSGNAGYCYAAKGSGKTLLAALDQFAAEQKHPEVAKVPLLLWGHSAGGQFNYNFACWKPDRTLAFIVNEGGFFYDTPAGPPTRSTPAILFAGEKDTPQRVQNITKLFENGRAKGALWSFCLEKGLGHAVGKSREIAQQFFRAIVTARLTTAGLDPGMKHLSLSDGLLAVRGEDAVPAAEFRGPPREASWLPDAATAAKWKAAQ